MTCNPIYDYPDPYANPRRGAQASPRNISLVGRLRLTQPVWLQLGINSATALHILQREPPGTFLVRRSNTRQCQVLCLRLPDNSSPAFVTTYRLHHDPAAISLEGSDLTFPSLLHLVASYCSAPDILPLSLRLPQPIGEASSCQHLEAIAHLGLEFWSSSLNAKGRSRPAAPVPPSRADAATALDPPVRSHEEPPCRKPTRDFPTSPLGGAPHRDVGARRQHFKNSIKVRVSTEAASPLSPPAAPPPPIPIGKKKKSPSCVPQPPVSGGGDPPACHNPLPQLTSWASARSEAYCTPLSKMGAKAKEAMGQHGVPLTPFSSSEQLQCVTEEEPSEVRSKGAAPDRFPWDIPDQKRGTLGNKLGDHTLPSSEPS